MSSLAKKAQLPLPLAAQPSFAAVDFLEDASNSTALAWLRHPETWPNGRLALWGPCGTGKTHLLHVIAAERGWALSFGLALPALPMLPNSPGLALDDADQAPEKALFHLINLCAERRLPLLLAAREAPARWPVALPDLRSRLRATTAVALHPPSDALLAALLSKQFADRQLLVDAGVQAWLLARLPRDTAAMAEAVARLDEAALAAGSPVTRALARTAFADLPGFGKDDESMAGETSVSPSGPGLL